MEGERADGGDVSAEHGRRRLEDDEAVSERQGVEWAATSWQSLVVGACGHDVELTLSTGSVVTGPVVDVGSSWCLVEMGAGSVAVLLGQVVSMRATLRATAARTVQRTLGSVLRRWARMRAEVSLEVVDGRVIRGRLRHVLSDAVTLADPRDVATTVPLSAMVAVRGPRLSVDE